MDYKIYAKSISDSVLEKFNTSNRVHSTFHNGINIRTKEGLIFIGTGRNRAPFGIYLRGEDFSKLEDIVPKDLFRFNLQKKELIIRDHIISLRNAEPYSSYIPKYNDKIDVETLELILNKILKLNFYTGFEMNLWGALFGIDSPLCELRKSLDIYDHVQIDGILKNIIGRGKGLTPSGDDLLLGMLLINRMGEVFNLEYTKKLKELIFSNILTTEVSINYYKSGFNGEFSSSMIDLYNGIINKDKDNIDKYITSIIDYGHTSGRDTLTGIALGIERLIKIRKEH